MILPTKNYHIRNRVCPRIVCRDGVSLSVQFGEDAYCEPQIDQDRPWQDYSSVEVGYICDENNKFILPPDHWEAYRDDDKVMVWGCVPVTFVEAFIDKHGGEVSSARGLE